MLIRKEIIFTAIKFYSSKLKLFPLVSILFYFARVHGRIESSDCSEINLIYTGYKCTDFCNHASLVKDIG